MDQMNQKIKEVFSDEAYVKEFLAFETPEEAQASLEEKGIEVSVEDLNQVADMLNKLSEGELTEEELVEITGGEACCIAAGITFAIATALTVIPIVGDHWGSQIKSGVRTAVSAVKNFFRRW